MIPKVFRGMKRTSNVFEHHTKNFSVQVHVNVLQAVHFIVIHILPKLGDISYTKFVVPLLDNLIPFLRIGVGRFYWILSLKVVVKRRRLNGLYNILNIWKKLPFLQFQNNMILFSPLQMYVLHLGFCHFGNLMR